MKIAIFGATGKTGQHLVRQALDKGYSVTALARSPGKMGIEHANLTIIQGDALDLAAVEKVVAGADAVASVLGPSKGAAPLTNTRFIENIISAMKSAGVRRLVSASGAGVGDALDTPGFVDKLIKFLLKTSARSMYEDMLTMASTIRTSDLEWTLVRVPMLTDDEQNGNIKVGYLGKGVGMRLSRADMAAFILGQVESKDYVQKAPVISN
jgi:putative NADH-flavin reductase